MIRTAIGAFAALVVLVTPGIASPGTAAPKVRLERVAPIERPTAMAVRAGDETLYVAEQEGRILAVTPDGSVRRRAVLDLRRRVTTTGNEQGLLGVAFSPAGSHLYVHFTNADGNTRVEEYPVQVDPRGGVTADPGSRRQVLAIRDPQPNHNGGQLVFGPDGTLYLGMGDGGSQEDEGEGHAKGGNGQSEDMLLGKILVVDVSNGGATICDVGLRNPWKLTFDRLTGDFWIADVGQDEWEEIDHLPAGDVCGHNLGWNVFEGRERFRDGRVLDHVRPVAVLSHDDGNCAVIGGYVYRGTMLPDLEGWYVFSDYCNGALRALRTDRPATKVDLGPDIEAPTAFGEDNAGELYVLSAEDGLFRLAKR